MSKAKYKAYRKVLNIEYSRTSYAGETIPVKFVLWCLVDSTTTRTVKTHHLGVACYVGGLKFQGFDARCPQKPVSINLKTPLESVSKHFRTYTYKAMKQEAFNGAYRSFLMVPERSKGLEGVVQAFCKDRGEGWLKCNKTGGLYQIHACNMPGKKTWYPGTACMYVEEGQTVKFDLADMGTHLIACVTEGHKFDAEKWASLDHDRLAFKCDENGNLINGLFK